MSGSYRFEELAHREVERDALVERTQLRVEAFPALLKRHGFKDGGKILEIGCAHGVRSRLLAEIFPNSFVTAIDRSRELLAESIRNGPVPHNLDFAEADLYSLPQSDETFDFIYARLVFMHLSNPLEALRSLARVLKPGGRILIEDADRDCMFFEPEPKSFAQFWRQVQAGQRKMGGDPNVGRKLATYFKQMNFTRVEDEIESIRGGGAEIAFLAQTLMPSLNFYLEPEERAAGSAAIADLAELSRDPAATYYHFWFAVSAQK